MAAAFLESIEERRFVFSHAAQLAGLADEDAYPPIVSLLPKMQRFPRAARLGLNIAGRAQPLFIDVVIRLAARRVLAGISAAAHPAELLGDVVLATSGRIVESVARVPANVRPHQWLLVPGIPAPSDIGNGIPAGDAILHLHDIATRDDVVRATLSARETARRLFRNGWIPATNLFALELFTWCLLWHVIEAHGRGVGRWWITNHYDQWALLLDRVDIDGERIVLQHGIEGGPGAHPARLLRTAVVYTYDDDSEQYFRQYILAHPDAVRFERMHPALVLTPVPRPPACSAQLLLVGSPLHLEREHAIIAELVRRRTRVHILLKPHPLFAATGYAALRAAGAELIGDPTLFPRVDIVISPLSTLGFEYAACGVPVVWHADRDAADVVGEVEELLSRMPRPAVSV